MNDQDPRSGRQRRQDNERQGAGNQKTESREQEKQLWDKTFSDNEDRNSEGYLSRTEHRKQVEHNSWITTILVVLIIILAASPLVFWLNHWESFNHPASQRVTRVASSRPHQHNNRISSQQKRSKTSKTRKRTRNSQNGEEGSTAESYQSSAYPRSNRTTTVKSGTRETTNRTSSSLASSNNGASSSSQTRMVTVSQGQGVYRVAVNNGMSVQELERMNGLTPGAQIHPGQQLKVRQ